LGASVLRLVHKLVEPAGVASYAYHGLAGGGSYRVEEYSVSLRGLILQDPPSADVYLYRGLFTLPPQGGVYEAYCRWHNGPLAERDDPLTRLYCPEPAPQGYCRRHRRSLRALYEECMSRSGLRSLEACRALDERERLEYTVYLLVAGGSVKVGVTRSWRLLDRLAEQPHDVATPLAVVEGAYRARKLEMEAARRGIASERPSRRVKGKRLHPAAAAALLEAAALRAARLLGLEWEGRLLRVKPPDPLPPEAPPERLEGSPLKPLTYWGGLLILDANGGQAALHTRSLLHRASIVKLGEEGQSGVRSSTPQE